jgi:hypothetical protein
MLFRFSLAPKISKMEKKIFAFVFRSLAPLFFQQNPLTNKSVWCGLSLDIWYIALSSGFLPSLFKLCPVPWAKIGHALGFS